MISPDGRAEAFAAVTEARARMAMAVSIACAADLPIDLLRRLLAEEWARMNDAREATGARAAGTVAARNGEPRRGPRREVRR